MSATAADQTLVDALKALWSGDLSYRMPAQGETADIAREHNLFLDRLQQLRSEHGRVCRELGTEGRFGCQAEVEGLSGDWQEMVGDLNRMAAHLTDQIRNFASVTTSIATGDFTRKPTVECQGEMLDWKRTLETFADQLNAFAHEITRLSRDFGTEGRFGGQAEVRGLSGTWKDLVSNLNTMSSHLTDHLRPLAEVTTCIATGDLTKKAVGDYRGELKEWQGTLNLMVDQLNNFASEVTRIMMEEGTLGIFGGQADVRGLSGTWKDVQDSVNITAANLTAQLRSISKHAHALGNGELPGPNTIASQGEMQELRDLVNTLEERVRSNPAPA